MSEKTRNIITYSVMVIIIALFLVSIFIGNNIMGDTTKDKTQNVDELDQTEKLTHDYKEQDRSKKDKTKEPNMMQESHKQKEIITPDPETLKEPEGFYRKHFTVKQIKQSKNTAKQFARNYYTFNGDTPKKHIKNARQYMTDKMYQKLIGSAPKPTSATYEKKAVSVEAYEPYKPSEDYFVWKVRITGDVYNSKGNKTKREIVEYTLKMKQTKEAFLVKNYTSDILHH